MTAKPMSVERLRLYEQGAVAGDYEALQIMRHLRWMEERTLTDEETALVRVLLAADAVPLSANERSIAQATALRWALINLVYAHPCLGEFLC
jgi:hypothetical protein